MGPRNKRIIATSVAGNWKSARRRVGARADLQPKTLDHGKEFKWHFLKPILGKVPDILIAECYGVTRERVRQVRTKFKIPLSYREKPPPKIPLRDLRTLSLKELSAKYNAPMGYVSQLRTMHGIDQVERPVTARIKKLIRKGAHFSMSDGQIAYKVGCSVSQVVRVRHAMGYFRQKPRKAQMARS